MLKRKVFYAKPVVKPPWSIVWPQVSNSVEDELMTKLKERLITLNFSRKPTSKGPRQKRENCDLSDNNEGNHRCPWNLDTAVKEQLLIGMSEVLRAVQNPQPEFELLLLLFDRDNFKPSMVGQFVGFACVPKCFSVAMKGLNAALASVFNIRVVNALGFRIRRSVNDSTVTVLRNDFQCVIDFAKTHLKEAVLTSNDADTTTSGAVSDLKKFSPTALFTPPIKNKKSKKAKRKT